MAKKTRLTKNAREDLFRLAQMKVVTPEETSARDSAYVVARDSVISDIFAKYPEKDMKVLAKYDMARRDECLRLSLFGGRIVQLMITGCAGPFIPGEYGCRVHLVSEASCALMITFEKAKDAEAKARERILSDYKALIFGASTFEQVVDVWPEAEELRSTICGTGQAALSVVTPDLAARIAADMAQRVAPCAT